MTQTSQTTTARYKVQSATGKQAGDNVYVAMISSDRFGTERHYGTQQAVWRFIDAQRESLRCADIDLVAQEVL